MSNVGPARPSIRDILTGHSVDESFSGLSDNDVAKLLSEHIPLGMQAGYALGNQLGIKSTAHAARLFREPYATVVLALAQALRHLGRDFTALYDTPRGCIIEATLPFDMLSFGGQLMFEVLDGGASETRVEGTSIIPGQMFAWGKGKRALKAALDSTQQYMSRHGF